MDNVEQRVKKIVAEQLGVNEAEIKNESSFVDDLGADSLDTVELVMALEEEFGTVMGDVDVDERFRPAAAWMHRPPDGTGDDARRNTEASARCTEGAPR